MAATIAQTQAGWARLPDSIISMIYCYLEDSDRLTVSRLCKKYNRVFYEPSLWRSVRFNIKSSSHAHPEFLEALRSFIQNVSTTTQKIVIKFEHQHESFKRQHAIYLQTILDEFSNSGKESQVHTLEVRNMRLEKLWEQFDTSKCIVVASISRFLEAQTKLKRLTLSSCLIRAELACMILQSLVRNPFSKTLQYLDLSSFVTGGYIWMEPKTIMKNMFDSFRRLKELRLNYKFLESIRVENVCDLLKETLEQLVLYASANIDTYSIFAEGRTISADRWRLACYRCPRLKLDFHICDQGLNPTRLLVAHMPLVKFSYTYRWDVNPNNDLETKVNVVLTRLAELSLPTLEEASFWVNGQDFVPVLINTEPIARILTTTTSLRQLSFSRQLMTPENKDKIQSELGLPRRDDVIEIV